MTGKPKLCIDCRFHRKVPGLFGPRHRCDVDGNVDVVDGSPVGIDCSLMRDVDNDHFLGGGRCGHEGRLFEPKPTPAKEAA